MILIYIVSATILLGLCIFVHELGHLLGGKMVGIKAKTFSIGYGNGFIKKKWGDTTYQITLIPFGGFCSFYGENAADKLEGVDYEFLTAKPWRRIVTVIMGPLFNLFFGIILFFIMNLIGFQTETNKIIIPDYLKTLNLSIPAIDAGLETGDIITSINDKSVYGFGDIQAGIAFSEGKKQILGINRNGVEIQKVITPVKFEEKGYFSIGVMPYGERVLVVEVVNGDIAYAAGIKKFDEIISIDGIKLKNSEEFIGYIRAHSEKPIAVQIMRRNKIVDITLTPRIKETLTVESLTVKEDSVEKFTANVDNIDLIKSAIERKQVKVNGLLIASFNDFITRLSDNDGKVINIENSGGKYSGIFKYQKYGYVGLKSSTAPEMIDIKYPIGIAFVKSLTDPYDFIVMNLKGMGMLFTGKLDVRENLSGPIRIAQIAGDTARYRGLSAFILLMAKISIILMVMNLLPIPAVDGSFIILFLYEMIKGKPIDEKILAKIQMFGFALIVMLGIFVIFNDLSQLDVIKNLIK